MTELVAVYSPRPYATWGRPSFPVQRIDPFKVNSDAPFLIGKTPIGLVSWYKYPPRERLFKDSDDLGKPLDTEYCPMRGSRAGIEAFEGTGRALAYKYYFAEWCGRRFAKWSKKTGKRTLVIKTKRDAMDTGHRRCDDIIQEDLRHGFDSEMHGQNHYKEFPDCAFIQMKDMRHGRINGLSSIICINLVGLDEAIARSVCDMAVHAASIEAIEDAMQELAR